MPLRGGEGAEGGIFEPRHCDACEATVTVVIVEDLAIASLLFWSANFNRFGRFVLDVS